MTEQPEDKGKNDFVPFDELPNEVHAAGVKIAAGNFDELTHQDLDRFCKAADAETFRNRVLGLSGEARNTLYDYLVRKLRITTNEDGERERGGGGYSAGARDQILQWQQRISVVEEVVKDANRM